MKYFSLAGIALLGYVAAAPATMVEYETLDEDCYEDNVDIAAADLYENEYIIPAFEVEDAECDDEPIEEFDFLEFEPAIAAPDEVFEYDEECEDSEVPDPTPAPTQKPETECVDCDLECYDEDDEYVEEYIEEEYEPNELDVLIKSYAAYDLDDLVLDATSFEGETNVDSIEECLEY